MRQMTRVLYVALLAALVICQAHGVSLRQSVLATATKHHSKSYPPYCVTPADESDFCVQTMFDDPLTKKSYPTNGGTNNCVIARSTASWVQVGSGSQISMSLSVTFSESESETTSTSVTNAFSASGGIGYGGLSVGGSYSHSVTTQVSDTFSETLSGTRSVSGTVDCQDGQAFQWVIVQSNTTCNKWDTHANTPIPVTQTVRIHTQNYVCVPAAVHATPQCPPTYCYNYGPSGDHAGCTCCNDAGWATDPSDGNVCS